MATHLGASLDRWPQGTPQPSGIVVFGYPLIPIGGRGKSDRVTHLGAIAVPTLIVQGTRDSFGGPDRIAAALATAGGSAQRHIAGLDALRAAITRSAVLKSAGRAQADVHAQIQRDVVAWMKRVSGRRAATAGPRHSSPEFLASKGGPYGRTAVQP